MAVSVATDKMTASPHYCILHEEYTSSVYSIPVYITV